MKKLYDEIMDLYDTKNNNHSYMSGFRDAKKQAAELAKKYDDEIDRLIEEINILYLTINDLEDEIDRK